MKKKQLFKRIAWTLLVLFVLMNIVAALHAWSFTHFSKNAGTKSTIEGSFWEKAGMLLTGINNPRPENAILPRQDFQTIIIESNVKLECWKINANSSLGTVLVCHGYGGSKSSMLDKAGEFLKMHYSVLLVDFMGTGGSEGDQTTIGFLEAQEVKSCCTYLESQGEHNVILFGTSMGAVAVMKAVSDYDLNVSSIIVECPFGTLYQTVCARFDMMNVPSFPMAALLTFWGGIENGFWAFGHEPVVYAQHIKCPVLLMYGEKDPKVSREEIDSIYANFTGVKQLVTFPMAGHENYLNQYRLQWESNVAAFLANNQK